MFLHRTHSVLYHKIDHNSERTTMTTWRSHLLHIVAFEFKWNAKQRSKKRNTSFAFEKRVFFLLLLPTFTATYTLLTLTCTFFALDFFFRFLFFFFSFGLTQAFSHAVYVSAYCHNWSLAIFITPLNRFDNLRSVGTA